jgi:hypothetical protein
MSDDGVVALDEGAPAGIAQFGELRGRPDDVGEENRDEDRLRLVGGVDRADEALELGARGQSRCRA